MTFTRSFLSSRGLLLVSAAESPYGDSDEESAPVEAYQDTVGRSQVRQYLKMVIHIQVDWSTASCLIEPGLSERMKGVDLLKENRHDMGSQAL